MRTLLPGLLLLPCALHAQSVDWLRADPIDYALNPDLPTHVICASDADHVYAARLGSISYLYTPLYGHVSVERYNAAGETLWSLPLGDTALVQSMASDADGNLIVGGRFFGTLRLGDEAQVDHLYGAQLPEAFLFALDADGHVLWQRNVAPPPFGDIDVAAITFDHLGCAWYAGTDFMNARIARLEADGSEAEAHVLADAKTIGSISFDPWGGLYVSGAASAPGMTINGTFFPVEPAYNFFVARLGRDGAAQWMRSAEDITFQRPRVVADRSGHAYLVGSPFDSLSWGDVHFDGPEWNSTFFLTRVDSTGHFDQGFQPPLGEPFAGQFELGHGNTIGVDDADGVYVLGTVSGAIHWGNGVTTDNGSNQDRAVTLLHLDAAGVPQWQISSSAGGYSVPQGIAMLPDGTGHLAVQAQGTFTMDGQSVEAGEDNGLVLVRVAPASATSIDEAGLGIGTVNAFPSPFDRTFQVDAPIDPARPVSVRLMDHTGRLAGTSTSLRDLGGTLLPGAYLVDIVQGTRHWRARVVKQ